MADLPPLPQPKLGRYRHYKGDEYEVVGVARHSETLEALVLYRPLYNQTGLWVRPYAMFFGRSSTTDASSRGSRSSRKLPDATPMSASDALIAALVFAAIIGLAIGVRGSLRRDAAFAERFAAASEEQKRLVEAKRPSGLSWRWLVSHVTTRGGIAIWAALALIAVAAMIARWT